MIDDKERRLAQSRARVIKALGHPTRMYIVARLAGGEASVGDLTAAVGADVSTVSKHLSLLKAAGLLADRKTGNKVLYSLVCPCVMQFIHCIDEVIVENAERGLSCVVSRASVAASEES